MSDDDETLTPTLQDAVPQTGRTRTTGFDGLVATERYVLTNIRGRGASGVVWSALDTVLQREVALKVLNRRPDEDYESRERFVYESRVTARLSHPSIIAIHDAGVLPDGRFFYAMPLVSGQTLRALLLRIRESDPETLEQWPLPRLLRTFVQVCNAMAYAHDNGVIHRDLKPENLLLGEYGELYIADWGIARAFNAGSSPPVVQRDGTETHVGRLLGTPNYMSPEQLAGETETLTPASDVYSLGVILFELLTHTVPFSGENVMALIFKVATSSTPSPAELFPAKNIPATLSAVCRTCLHRDVALRTLTAGQLAMRLTTYLDGVEESRRRAGLARASLDQARRIAASYQGRHGRLAEEKWQTLSRIRSAGPAVELEARRRLWKELQAIEQSRMDVDALHSRAVNLATQSLIDVESADARDLLADLYWMKVEEAREARDDLAEAYFRSLVEQNDAGRYRDRLAGHGEIELHVPADAIVAVYRYVPEGPVLVPVRVPVRRDHVDSLPVGSYVARIEAPQALPMNVPFLIEGNRRCELRAVPPPTFPGAERFVPVSVPSARIGGDLRASGALPPTIIHPTPFLMGRFPVTLREYAAFLDALAESDPDEAQRRAPRSAGRSWLQPAAVTGQFMIPEVDADGDRWDPEWPVEMIDWSDAVAYCEWCTRRDGVLHRLPTDEEWELAARGVDQRVFPWGNGFDPALCMMDRSLPGTRLPVPVGTFEFDVSPFGVFDMAGLVFEWTATLDPTDSSRVVQRGGSRRSPEDWCRAGVRRFPPLSTTTPLYGFRVVRAWTP